MSRVIIVYRLIPVFVGCLLNKLSIGNFSLVAVIVVVVSVVVVLLPLCTW